MKQGMSRVGVFTFVGGVRLDGALKVTLSHRLEGKEVTPLEAGVKGTLRGMVETTVSVEGLVTDRALKGGLERILAADGALVPFVHSVEGGDQVGRLAEVVWVDFGSLDLPAGSGDVAIVKQDLLATGKPRLVEQMLNPLRTGGVTASGATTPLELGALAAGEVLTLALVAPHWPQPAAASSVLVEVQSAPAADMVGALTRHTFQAVAAAETYEVVEIRGADTPVSDTWWALQVTLTGPGPVYLAVWGGINLE